MTAETKIVPVALGGRSYDIHIEAGAIDRAGVLLAPFIKRGRAIVITDRNVADLWLDRLTASLCTTGVTVEPIILPAGESTKSWAQLEALTDRLLDFGVERSDAIIALGGGVIGDLVGFAAAILKRGCDFIQIPTTLLSQVDSSVGGKTAINSKAGKNLIGAFHQPVHVLIDPDVLDSLPIREVRAGYAEVIKYGLIGDKQFFDWCLENGAKLLAGDDQARIYAIAMSVAAKAAVVAADERETLDRRALLNLGHTFGHALEAEMGFSSRLLHGEAVAVGMVLALRYSARIGIATMEEADQLAAHFRSLDMAYDLATSGVRASGATLVEHMLHDKKMTGGKLPFILCHGIGDARVEKGVDLADVTAFLDAEA